MKTTSLIALPLLLSLHLAACNKPQSAAENRKEVAAEQAEGIKEVGKAVIEQQSDEVKMGASDPMGQVTSDELKKAADNTHKVDKEIAEANYAIAKAKCDTETGNVKDACVSEAKANYDAAIVAADARLSAARNAATP